jgi:hypothetical protein
MLAVVIPWLLDVSHGFVFVECGGAASLGVGVLAEAVVRPLRAVVDRPRSEPQSKPVPGRARADRGWCR